MLKRLIRCVNWICDFTFQRIVGGLCVVIVGHDDGYDPAEKGELTVGAGLDDALQDRNPLQIQHRFGFRRQKVFQHSCALDEHVAF